ncbi:MAG: beta-phosphoglucomutase [Clostridia bacterium]|nr:beta-phosphoglucomutase [Clostridia bacterium]
MQPKAFLLDLDGVITDTAQYHYLAWSELCQTYGFRFSEADNERLKGVSRMRSLEIILELNGKQNTYNDAEKQQLTVEKNDRYVQMIRQMTPADILPGVSAFLKDCRQAGIRLAVASASRNAPEILRLLGIAHLFDYVADAAKIPNSKPAPDVFLVCSQALDLPPACCVGIEDALAGVQAIHAAGMPAVGIRVAPHPVHKPDIALTSTAELSLPDLLKQLQSLS